MSDLTDLHGLLVKLGREGAARQLPIDVLQDTKQLIETLENYGIKADDLAPPADPFLPPGSPASPAPAQPQPTPEAPAAPKANLAIQRAADGSLNVTAKDAESAAVARTVQQLLNALFGKPIGSVAERLLEIAGQIEAISLENEQLRAYIQQHAAR